jgi:hypothetical protein
VRWIISEPEFRSVLLKARECTYIDSRRIQTSLKLVRFDDAEICTGRFAEFIQLLMEWSGDTAASYLVLDPDPVHYFHHYFNKYPLIEISRGDSSESYLSHLNEDPGGSPGDAVGTNWWSIVIVPESIKWFVHALRSEQDDSGHLWVPSVYLDRVHNVYPQARGFETA